MMDEELAQWFEKIRQRTGVTTDRLVWMALWDFVRSFDWNYEELREGVIYRESSSESAFAMARP